MVNRGIGDLEKRVEPLERAFKLIQLRSCRTVKPPPPRPIYDSDVQTSDALDYGIWAGDLA